MNRILGVSVLLVSLGVTGSAVTAQTAALPTIDQVLEKYIAGSGGRAALEKVTSFRAQGTITVAEAGVSGTIELQQKAPDKAATTVEIAGTRQREVFDGSIGWSEDPSGVREKAGAELAEAKRSATFGRELRMKTIYKTLTVSARDKVGSRAAVVVDAVPADGSATKLFFDAESGVLLKQVGTRLTAQGPLEVEVTYEDYRAVDGVQRPFTIRQATAMFTAVIQITDLKHNVPIDDAVFKKPGL
jgi:hypothetical protein